MTVALDDGKLDRKWLDDWAKRCFVPVEISEGKYEAAIVRCAQQIEHFAEGIESRFNARHPEPAEAFEIDFHRWLAVEIKGYQAQLAEIERG